MNDSARDHTDGLSFDEVLRTTRSVRRRLDLTRPVDPALVWECLELALQAPSGSNAQGWRFVVVQDADKRAQLADMYRSGFERYRTRQGAAFAEVPIANSVSFLAEHLQEVPLHVTPCIDGRLGSDAPDSVRAAFMASIIPATWSFMLACRSRGLGTCWTTMDLAHEREAAVLLGIPYDAATQIALIPVGHTIGSDFSQPLVPTSTRSQRSMHGRPQNDTAVQDRRRRSNSALPSGYPRSSPVNGTRQDRNRSLPRPRRT